MNTSRSNSIGRALVLAILASGVIVIPIASYTQTSVPKWEAVSIKPCAPPRPGQRGGLPQFSPGRATWNCQNVFSLIATAFSVNQSVLDLPAGPEVDWPLTGGPSWIQSDPYQIIAKAEGSPDRDLMTGPMLQVLLEDRFKLKIHRETHDTPVYALTVSKGGAKLQPFQEGSCVPLDFKLMPQERPPLPVGQRHCSMGGGFSNRLRLNYRMDAEGVDLDTFASMLFLDRKVINRTGITGLFEFHIEYAREGDATQGVNGAPTGDPAGPSVHTVLERLGLKLEATKAPGNVLVVDSVERPTEN